MTKTAGIGLRAKTGKAIAVVLIESRNSPQLLRREILDLTDARDSATGQPHHEVMHLPWREATEAVQPIVRRIERAAARALSALVDEVQSDGFTITAVGIVGAPDRNLEKIGSPHIRAHAAEGVLFRQVLELAAKEAGLPVVTFSERNFQLDKSLDALGRAAGPPWRADEKAAATAAWLALTRKAIRQAR